MRQPCIKVYGERNTNTNYISELLRLNLEVAELPSVAPYLVRKLQSWVHDERVIDTYFRFTFRSNLGWKHSVVRNADELKKAVGKSSVYFLTITKNPYSWLLSLFNKPYHVRRPENTALEEFIQTPLKTVGRDNCPPMLKSPVELWNLKNESYFRLDGHFPVVHTTTEEIFVDPGDVIERISAEFGIGKSVETFQNFEQSTKDSSKDSEYYRNYYLNELWRDKLSSEAIASINEFLDRSLMERFGYKLIS